MTMSTGEMDMEIWLCQACGLVRDRESYPADSLESGTKDNSGGVSSFEEFERLNSSRDEKAVSRPPRRWYRDRWWDRLGLKADSGSVFLMLR